MILQIVPNVAAPLDVQEQPATAEDNLPEPVRRIERIRVEHGPGPICAWRVRYQNLGHAQHAVTEHRTSPQVMAKALTLDYHFGLPLCTLPTHT